MKKMFLASSACVTLDLINELLPKTSRTLKAAFIPTAADPYVVKDFVDADRTKLVTMGFQLTEIDLKKTYSSDLEKALENVDLIFVAGGNTFYLLDQVRKSGFDILLKKLINKGVIYVGSSAGSILCCPTIEGAKRFDDAKAAPTLLDYSGLNLFDKIIIPHANVEKYEKRIEETITEMNNNGHELIKLNDNQAVIVNGTDWKIIEI